jgi:hypothetical protein
MSSTDFMDVNMEVNDLAEFMFLKNENNVVLELSLGGIENNKDLFCFLLDIFCKGLVLMFGNGTKSVNIEDITLDNFTKIKEKMLCAGININLQMFPSDIIDDTGVAPQAQLNLDEINMADDNIQLQEYEFKVMNATTTYVISFNLVHRQL